MNASDIKDALIEELRTAGYRVQSGPVKLTHAMPSVSDPQFVREVIGHVIVNTADDTVAYLACGKSCTHEPPA